MDNSTKYTFHVDGDFNTEFTIEDLERLDITEQVGGKLSIIYNNTVYNVEVLHYSSDKQLVELKVNGESYPVNYDTPLDRLIDKLGLDEIATPDSMEVLSPMPGVVIECVVAEGDEIAQGDKLIILEAMKMENAIIAEMDGIVESVAIEKDQSVDKSQLLLTIKKAEETT